MMKKRENMLLAIDIGNTSISFAILHNKNIKHTWVMSTALNKGALQLQLRKVLSQIKKQISSLENIIICSVVPKSLKAIKPIIEKGLGKKSLVVGSDLKVPIKNRYRHPSQVGQDRLVCAYSAKMLYGSPTIVVDFGTAITFDVISRKGEYMGGIIVPGIRLSAESLSKKTALLPQTDIKSPSELIGRDTQSSILSGIFYGYGAMCDGLIEMISKKKRIKPTIVATGGYTSLLKKFSKKISLIDDHLVFKGMSLVYSKVFEKL